MWAQRCCALCIMIAAITRMKRLNYNHLYYFWTVASTGSVSEASRELKVSQPTVSEQIHALEEELGQELFRRAGRNLVLTDSGKLVFRYARKIFRVGEEMSEALARKSKSRHQRTPRRK